MKKHDNVKLDVISGIDDDIIERNTVKRFSLLHKVYDQRKKKRWIPFVAMAACFALIFGMVAILLADSRVPVYQGMTVSNTAPAAKASVRADEPSSLSSLMSQPSSASHALSASRFGTAAPLANENGNGNAYGHDKDNNGKDADTLLEGVAQKLYYAEPNTDIYITVHIDNPASYEILSFTLNG
ncbi:MAG: hypothetical protein E7664_04200, partial [Ruminococcaceae bacterium]|nr:hypothetical protein [Oscillospiraceae bacterium]